jgi:hypothetical protein
MSKQMRTLSVIGSAIASWSNGVTASATQRKALLAQCEALTLIEKQRIDEELVNYYAKQAGVGVKQREKAHALFCGSVPAWEKNDKGQVANPAAMALSRARGVVFAKEKDTPAARGAKKTSGPKFTMETLLPGVGAFIESMNGEKISAAQKREVRQAATLLLGLINA